MPKKAPTLIKMDQLDQLDEPPHPPAEVVDPPKPGDADYDWSPHYDTADLYTHIFPDGTVIAIKSMAAIYSKTWLYKTAQMKSASQVEIMSLDRAACEVASGLLMSLDDSDGDPVQDLIDGWIKHGTGLGDDDGLTSGN